MSERNHQLAKQLFGMFKNKNSQTLIDEGYSQLTYDEKASWMRVADFVSDMILETVIMYGYNGKESYESELDKLISEGRK